MKKYLSVFFFVVLPLICACVSVYYTDSQMSKEDIKALFNEADSAYIYNKIAQEYTDSVFNCSDSDWIDWVEYWNGLIGH